MHLCDHTFHAEVLPFGLCGLDHGLCHIFQVLREPHHEAIELGDAATLAVIVAIWVRTLQLRLQLVRLDEALLHLLLEALEAGPLPFIDLLIGSFHLSWSKLQDGIACFESVVNAEVHLVQVLLRGQLGSSLDPL